MMTGSTISKEFEIISLFFSVAVTVSATIGTFGNMALSIPGTGLKNNYFPIILFFFRGRGRGWWWNLGNYLLESGRGQHN